MESTGWILGLGLMVAGMVLMIISVFRALAHTWTHGLYEVWVFPAAGGGLILLGLWLIR